LVEFLRVEIELDHKGINNRRHLLIPLPLFPLDSGALVVRVDRDYFEHQIDVLDRIDGLALVKRCKLGRDHCTDGSRQVGVFQKSGNVLEA
jgi:hypothetical protein